MDAVFDTIQGLVEKEREKTGAEIEITIDENFMLHLSRGYVYGEVDGVFSKLLIEPDNGGVALEIESCGGVCEETAAQLEDMFLVQPGIR